MNRQDGEKERHKETGGRKSCLQGTKKREESKKGQFNDYLHYIGVYVLMCVCVGPPFWTCTRRRKHRCSFAEPVQEKPLFGVEIQKMAARLLVEGDWFDFESYICHIHSRCICVCVCVSVCVLWFTVKCCHLPVLLTGAHVRCFTVDESLAV